MSASRQDETALQRARSAVHNFQFMRIARRYLIGGRVQGVGFRFFTESLAAVEGLHGWVRNLHDGRVEVRFEGEQDSVDRAESKLRRGPPGARVESFAAEPEAPSERPTGFSIRS
ncbi:MAG TPA: acylphosphatase [Vicinamibacterales bacterium]|jgi:acylphosphatase|nr:acylphosphatase [Vicinamibacterales bacterium]